MSAQPSATGIFISYRRDDATGASGRIYDWMRIAFGRERVFRDVASIGPGKWRDKIDRALAASGDCLPVIGRRWFDENNARRLFNHDDMVRHEIRTALSRRGMTLIPTLVEGAALPNKNLLPPELAGLLEWNAYPLSETGWEDDTRRLLDAVAEATGLDIAPDTDRLLAGEREAEDRLRDEKDQKLQSDQIRALTRTIADLTRRLADEPAGRRATIGGALAALGQGNTAPAEAEFERVLAERSVAAATAGREAADAARNIANLALLSDIGKAVTYYRRAVELDPGAAENWRLLGHACMIVGDTPAAQEALSRALNQAGAGGEPWDAMAAHLGLGDLAKLRGDLSDALICFVAATRIASAEIERDPANTQWQRDLSVSWERIGDVRVAQGELPAALEAFEAGMEIRRRLAERDPANTQWQRDVVVSCWKLASLLLGDPDRSARGRRLLGDGLAILQSLNESGRLAPSQQAWIAIIESKLTETGHVAP